MDNSNIDKVKGYRNQVEFCLENGEGIALRQIRDQLVGMTTTELQDIDESALDYILYLDYVADYLLTDDNSQPLANWWWHLGKIRDKSYPTDLLPAHLQAVYGRNTPTGVGKTVDHESMVINWMICCS